MTIDMIIVNTFIEVIKQIWVGYSFTVPEVILAFIFLVSLTLSGSLALFHCAEFHGFVDADRSGLLLVLQSLSAPTAQLSRSQTMGSFGNTLCSKLRTRSDAYEGARASQAVWSCHSCRT
jgi:hypothetical protein